MRDSRTQTPAPPDPNNPATLATLNRVRPAQLAVVDDELRQTATQAEAYAANALAKNTRRAYTADWTHYTAWCAEHSLEALPATPETVAMYLTHLAHEGYAAATLARRLVAIRKAHELKGHESPTRSAKVRTVHSGIRRTIGTAQEGKAPAVTEDVREMLRKTPRTLLGTRDRALILLGFATACRRGDLVTLDVEDLEFVRSGVRVRLRGGKTDQERRGRTIGVPNGRHPDTCPVRAVRTWLTAAAVISGPVFRAVNKGGRVGAERLSDKAVVRAVKAAAKRAGLDPSRYGGHSLRAGLATSAAAAGVSERSIMAQTGHRSTEMVRRYIRDGEVFRDNAAGQVGL
jgi:site-specific recombinase XerD